MRRTCLVGLLLLGCAHGREAPEDAPIVLVEVCGPGMPYAYLVDADGREATAQAENGAELTVQVTEARGGFRVVGSVESSPEPLIDTVVQPARETTVQDPQDRPVTVRVRPAPDPATARALFETPLACPVGAAG